MGKKDLVALAKGNKKKLNNLIPAVKKTPDKPLSSEEERDLKAKQKVKELLENIPTKIGFNDDELLEVVDSKEIKDGTDWLNDQVALLTESNEALTIELAQSKEDYQKLYAEFKNLRENGNIVGNGIVLNDGSEDNNIIKNNVINLFNEIQGNYFAMGKNPATGLPNLVLAPVAFMNRMIQFFPFLSDERRY